MQLTRRPWMIFILRNQDNGGGGGAAQPEQQQAQPVRIEEEPFDDPFLQSYQEPAYIERDSEDELEDGGDESIQALLDSFTPEDDDAAALNNNVDPQANQQAAQAMGQQLKEAIDNMRFPDDMFDDDFRQGDPQAVRGAMEKMTRFAVQQAVSLALKPTTLAMKQMHEQITTNMEAQIRKAQGQTSQRAKLEAAVPAMADPKSAALLKPIYDHLVKSGTPHAEQVKTLNAMAARLKLNKTSNQGGSNRPRDGRAITGAAALDNLFG